MTTYFQAFWASLVAFLPSLLGAILVLVIGWIVALVVSNLVGALLKRTNVDNRLANALAGGDTAQARRMNTEVWISRAVFWLIMLFVIIAFLQMLNLTFVSQPLSNLLNQILLFIPGLLGGLVLLFIAWIVATVLRLLVTRVLSSSGIARRITTDADVKTQDRVTISQTIGNLVYWLVFLLFLPAILQAMHLEGLLAPIQNVVNEIVGILPNLLGAAVILIIGWLIARIIRQLVVNILAGIGIDRLGERVGMQRALGQRSLSDIIGAIVYVLILIPVAIAALNVLNIPAITVPATNMLNNVLNALPAIFGAALLLIIAWFLARLVGGFIATLLTGLGFNRLFNWIGLTPPGQVSEIQTPSIPTTPGVPGEGLQPTAAGTIQPRRITPSDVVGYIVTVAIMLFAVMEAADLLGFNYLAVLVSDFIIAAARVLVGLVIFGIGLYLASLADRLVRDSGVTQANILAPAARVAIIIFSAALALREMGIAESIVNLAFGLLLGAIAVAVALAFGLGGREVASRQLEQWTQNLRSGPGSMGAGLPRRDIGPGETTEPDKF